MGKLFNFFTVLLVSILFVSSLYAQKNSSQIKIEPQMVDFGTIYEKNGIISQTVKVTNVSNRPYILNYITSSCGCTIVDFSKKPLPPKESREMTIKFDPKKRKGYQDKKIYLISNNSYNQDTIFVKADVIPREKTVAELYPLNIYGDLLMSSYNFSFGLIYTNEVHTMKLEYYNDGKKDIKVDFKIDDKSPYESLEFYPSVVKPGERGEVRLTYNLIGIGETYGDVESGVSMFVDGEKINKNIVAKAMIIPNFLGISQKERDDAPYAVVGVVQKDLVANAEDKVVEYNFPVENTGNQNLKILYHKTNNPRVKATLGKSELKKGESTYIKVKIDTDGLMAGKHEFNVSLIFNAPDSPIEMIYITLDRR